MIRLTVVRHGETEFNALGLIGDNSLPEKFMDHLSEKGKLQAIEVANQLGGRKFDVVILSPFVRTRETLELFLRSFSGEVVVLDLVAERNAGVFAGMPKSAMKEFRVANGITDAVGFRPEKGESLLDVYQRALEFLDFLRKDFDGKSVLLCSHVNFLRCLDIAIVGRDVNDFYSFDGLENGEIKEYDKI